VERIVSVMVHIFFETKEFWDAFSIYAFFSGNYLVFAVLGFIGFLSCISTFEPFLPRSTNDPFSEEADE
jgi:hypothetical protein